METYTLVLAVYQGFSGGRTTLCGMVSIKGGGVLQEALHMSTMRELSIALKKGGYIPHDLQIIKRNHQTEFQYVGKKIPKSISKLE